MKTIKKITLGECAEIIPGVLPQEKKKAYCYTAVLPVQLTADGVAGEFGSIFRDTPCEEKQFLRAGDVLLKRLNPDCAIVFEDHLASVVAAANIFIIRPHAGIDSQYLAFLVEKSKLLQRITQLSGVGTTVAALSISQVANGVIPLPPFERQQQLGKLWALSKKKERLLRKMMQENDRLMHSICGKLYQ